MNLFYDKRPVDNFEQLIDCYGPGELESPTRSTVPLLSLVKSGGRIWNEILELPGVGYDRVEAHFEYTVEPPRGKGEASHTDLMLIQGDRVCAVEARWTEPRYPTVADWRKKGGDTRDDVLRGWLSLFSRPTAGRTTGRTTSSSGTFGRSGRAGTRSSSRCSAGVVESRWSIR